PCSAAIDRRGSAIWSPIFRTPVASGTSPMQGKRRRMFRSLRGELGNCFLVCRIVTTLMEIPSILLPLLPKQPRRITRHQVDLDINLGSAPERAQRRELQRMRDYQYRK